MTTTPDQLLRMRDVEVITTIRRSKIYMLIANGTFPAPVKIGSVSRWSHRAVSAWVSERCAEAK